MTVESVYFDMGTKNKSFLDTHYYLKKKGILNNNFFLLLRDKDLYGIDPRNPKLDMHMRQKIFKECMNNYWYFLREIVRIPIPGGYSEYKLDRGLLAFNFGLVNNFSLMVDLPTQCGKNITIDTRVLWEYLFHNQYSAVFIDRDKSNSKMDLQRIKGIYELLPSYLKFKDICKDKTLHIKDKTNYIRISNKPRTKATAENIARGYTQCRQIFTDFQLLPYNEILFQVSRPAAYTAGLDAEKNNIPFGTVLLTSGGDIDTKPAQFADKLRESSIKFSEKCYDANPDMLNEYMECFSLIMYIGFDAFDLQKSNEWITTRLLDMNKDWKRFMREIFIQWR